MQILGENLWLTILFWLIIIIVIAFLIFCCVAHFVRKGEQQEKEPEWYTKEAELRPENYCKANGRIFTADSVYQIVNWVR